MGRRRGNRQIAGAKTVAAKYPRHSLEKALRIPRAVLDQNAGKECSETEAASFLGVKLTGEIRTEISSALKYGLLERPTSGRLRISELAKKILRPQASGDEVDGLREAVMKAPEISDVYKHYRGENLPDQQFFDNALTDTFHIPTAKLSEFKAIFLDTLEKAKLLEDHGGKKRLLDVSQAPGREPVRHLLRHDAVHRPPGQPLLLDI